MRELLTPELGQQIVALAPLLAIMMIKIRSLPGFKIKNYEKKYTPTIDKEYGYI